MAKITVLGGFGPGDSIGAVYRAFQRAGHEVTHNVSLPDPPKSLTPGDILFTWGACSQKLSHELISTGGFHTRVFWSIDDPNWSDRQTKHSIVGAHDIVLTCCADSVKTYKALGVDRTYFLPPAVDHKVFKPWTELPREDKWCANVSFGCTNLYPKKIWVHAQIDRENLIKSMAKIEKFKLWGPDNFNYLPGFQRRVSWEEMALVHANTWINLNFNLMCNRNLYFNERFFCIAGVGQAQMVDRTKGYEETFKDGEELIYASSIEEVHDKINFYIHRPELLEAIGVRLFARLEKWNYDTFAALVMDAVGGKNIKPSFI